MRLEQHLHHARCAVPLRIKRGTYLQHQLPQPGWRPQSAAGGGSGTPAENKQQGIMCWGVGDFLADAKVVLHIRDAGHIVLD
jgi:hypothetical protein